MNRLFVDSTIQFLDTRLNIVRQLVTIAIISIFSLMVLVVFAQVVWRFVFNNPFPWSEELARYLQVWLILLASVACIRKGRHLAVDFFTQVLPFKVAKIFKLLSLVCILLFTGVLFVVSIHLIQITIHQITPAIRVPIMVVYLAFPVSAFLMFMETLILFLKMTGARDRAKMQALEENE